eukprot:65957_1
MYLLCITLFILSFVNYTRVAISIDIDDLATQNTHLLHNHDQSDYKQSHDNNSSLRPYLPSDVMEIISGYLQKKEMYRLIRTCKLYLNACRRYIRVLLLNKFDYLLRSNNQLTVDDLLKIPFVDSIEIHALNMISFFRRVPVRGGRCIGIDRATGHGLLSFLLTNVINVQLQGRYKSLRYYKVITIAFNETNIHQIYASQSQPSVQYIQMFKINSLVYGNSTSSDIDIISKLLQHGKINSILGDMDTWYVADKITKRILNTCECSIYLFSVVLVALVGWFVIYIAFHTSS